MLIVSYSEKKKKNLQVYMGKMTPKRKFTFCEMTQMNHGFTRR